MVAFEEAITGTLYEITTVGSKSEVEARKAASEWSSRISRSASLYSRHLHHLVNFIFRALGSNPFNCDCKLRWLSEWVKRDYIEPGIAKCSYPSQLQDKLILTTPSDHFQCNGKVVS